MARQQVSALQAEVLQLNTELDDLDKQMVRAQSRIDSARDTEADLRSQVGCVCETGVGFLSSSGVRCAASC